MAEKKIPYEEGWILPEKKQYWFMKRSAADVDISDDKGGDFFTYTPGFGDFKDIDLDEYLVKYVNCLLYTSPSPRDLSTSRMPSSA